MQETIKHNIKKNTLLIKIAFIILGLFIPMLMLFIFGGEINLNTQNWLVATWGKQWGTLNDGTIGFGVNVGAPIVSWQPFVIALGIILANSIVFSICVKYKILDIMFYSILFATWFVFFNIILTGLLYANPKDTNGEAWKILVRLVIILVSFIIIFFPLNWILSTILLHSPNAQAYTEQLISKETEAANYIKENIDIIKPKKKKKVTSVDVVE